MGSSTVRRPARRRRKVRRRPLWIAAALVVAAALALAAGVLWWSGATLAVDGVALARVEVQPLGGSLLSARASAPDGARIPLSVQHGRLLPRKLLTPGETVTIVTVVRRPGWLAWALGRDKTDRLSVRAPVARLTQRWPTISPHASLELRFADPVDRISYRRGAVRRLVPAGGRRVVSLGRQGPSGTVEVSSAPRSWERLGAPVRVSWFPPSRLPGVLVSPGSSEPISPRDPIQLTFSRPVTDALGAARPRFATRVSGRWSETDSHTLVFRPTGDGFRFASSLRLELPRTLSVNRGSASAITSRSVDWDVAGASFLRLQQLLADGGYLPLSWKPAGEPIALRLDAEVDAAVAPPAGSFSWRYPNTPQELQRLWSEGQPNQVVRGAVMMFEQTHNLAVDGSVGPQVWHALLADAVAGTKRSEGYSYVYVHRDLPQLLTLWHNGRTVLTSPGNTGVPAAPTQLGTYPVFEHIPVGTMSGTNPDGSHYNDPGIRWISYFHGGDALHSFTRASFGTPQSLGCVELPLAVAARVWPYTPIGTLVTIEN
jgi:peptidoglycan hydrolase-like protein with peptidoglycan-binding domain